MKQISGKKWTVSVLIAVWVILISGAVLVIMIDPYLHYRIPSNRFSYVLTADQRSLNDGFIRHFNYDAVITGTSMTENFKTSEFDKLFGVASIKIPFSGGSYKEVNDACKRVLEVRPDTKIMVRSLDLSMLVMEKDATRYSNYPEYLYNDKLLDDVNYWLNKTAILKCIGGVILHSLVYDTGPWLDSFSFDEYCNWQQTSTFGKERVLSGYVRPEKNSLVVELTDEEKEMIYGNVTQNVTELAREYPDTRFLLFFTPYSICYWDSLEREGKLEWEIEAQRIAIEEILKCDNIELFSFCNNFEIVCDLNNYTDSGHYSEEINSYMLEWMQKGEYRLTWNNYEDYLQEISDFYEGYDYDVIFE